MNKIFTLLSESQVSLLKSHFDYVCNMIPITDMNDPSMIGHNSHQMYADPITENILNYADFIGSTSSLLRYVSEDNSRKFIVATEPHILHQMKKNEPNKTFLVAPGNDGSCSCSNCPYMELNTLEKLRDCLLHLSPEIKISNELILNAKKPLNLMLKLS